MLLPNRICSCRKIRIIQVPNLAKDIRHHGQMTRKFSISSICNQLEIGPKAELKAQEETQDVTLIDRLMSTIRLRTNAQHRSIVPMRAPRLWSETIHQTSIPPSESTSNAPQGNADSPFGIQERSMHDSYSEFTLPFSSSPELLEEYMNAWGGLRTGRLMEHLDSLAGSIAYKHMLGPGVLDLGKIEDRGFYIVTASVDRLDILSSLYPVTDLRLSGHVIYTGKSSMEIAVKMEALEGDSQRTAMLGRFSMVCRDAKTHKARQVHPLITSTPEEISLIKIGEAHKARKQLLSQRSLSRVPPSSDEAAALHNLYLDHLKQGQLGNSKETNGGDERVWMGNTKLERTMLMFPQERNVHQKIFGGYLMRLAYELGFANATLFMRTHLRFLSLDGISFARPVPIGSILRLTSHITHTVSSEKCPGMANVHVQANVVDPATGTEQNTNDFKFTWCIDEGAPPLKRTVVPQTYSEAMLWIEGKRALEMGADIRGLRRQY